MEKKEIAKILQSYGLYLHNFSSKLGNFTTCEQEVIEIIQGLVDKAREEGRKEMVENLLKKAKHMAKDYFTGQTKIYIDKDILEGELSKLNK